MAEDSNSSVDYQYTLHGMPFYGKVTLLFDCAYFIDSDGKRWPLLPVEVKIGSVNSQLTEP